MAERITDRFIEAILRHQQEEERIVNLYEETFNLLKEKGEDEPQLSISKPDQGYRTLLTKLDALFLRLRIPSPPEGDELVGYQGVFTPILVEWCPEEILNKGIWNQLAKLAVTRYLDGTESASGTQLGRKEFDESEIMVGFGAELDLVEGVLREIFDVHGIP